MNSAVVKKHRLWHRLVLVLLIAALLALPHRANAKGIHVIVEAAWNETSFIQEGCEWAGRNFGVKTFYSWVNAFWSFSPPEVHPILYDDDAKDRVKRHTAAVGARLTPQRVQHAAVLAAAKQLPETQMADGALLAVEMAARVYSPAVEAHYAVATQAWQEAAVQLANNNKTKLLSNGTTVQPCACGSPFGFLYTRILSKEGELQGHAVCTAAALAELQTALQQRLNDDGAAATRLTAVSNVSLTQLDYRYPAPSLAPEVAAVFVLYGLLASSRTRALHDAAVAWTTQADTAASLAYFFRHLPVSCARLCRASNTPYAETDVLDRFETPLAVQGYGVTVDIKSMEYKVVDEKAAARQKTQEETTEEAKADATTPSTFADPAAGVVSGFNVPRLQQRYPHLSQQLRELATLLEDEVDSVELKVNFDAWELQNIGLAATQFIREVENNSRRLYVLQDMVSRFPAYATALSRIAAQPSRFELIQRTLSTVQRRLQPGASALFVDGWRVEERDLSLFGVLDALRADDALSRDVRRAVTTRVMPRSDDSGDAATHVPRAVAKADVAPGVLEKVCSYVKRIPQHVSGDEAATASAAAYAIPAKYVSFLNDVETEPTFEGMPTQLSTFFTRVPNVLPFPRRNLLTYVFIWNPLRRSHLHMGSLIYRLSQNVRLARYGLLLLDPEWTGEIKPWKKAPVSRDVATISALAYHFKEAGMPERFLDVLIQIFQASTATAPTSENIPTELVQKVCERVAQTYFHLNVDALLGHAGFLTYYYETQEMLRGFPMPEYPATLLNGVVVLNDIAHLNEGLQREVNQLKAWVNEGLLQDYMDDLYSAILELRGAADHVQPALLQPPRTMRWTATQDLVAFIEDAPYVYSAAYAMDVPSVTQLVALPCHFTVQTLRQLRTVLTALQSCEGVVKRKTEAQVDAPHAGVCRRLRASMLTCSTAAAPAAASDAASARPLTAADAIAAFVWQAARLDVTEAKRIDVVLRYVNHLLTTADITQMDDSAALDEPTVAATFKQVPRPADLYLTEETIRHYHRYAAALTGQHDLWAALQSAEPAGATNVTLITNGRIQVMDDTFRAWDVLEAAKMVLPMTKAVEETVLKVNFAEMTTTSGEAAYSAEEMDNTFYGGKVACLTSVFAHEEAEHSAVKSTSSLIREEMLFASPEDRKKLRSLLFTVDNTQVNSSSSSSNSNSDTNIGGVHQITAVVDPSSRDAQLVVSLVAHLMQSPLRLRLTVLLNPSLDVKFPIRDFYTYVASAAVEFDKDNGRVVPPAAVFTRLPATALLTLGVEEPPTWTVFSQAAEEDLDNILLSKLPSGASYVSAVYRMHSLLVTGDATNVESGEPPVGLPLSLTPATQTSHADPFTSTTTAHSTDTQVMANLNGYYQLQATPGLWYLSVKPGPVAAGFCLSAIGTESVAACAAGTAGTNFTQGQHIPVVIDSFSGRYLSLEVQPTPHKNPNTRQELRDILHRMAADATHSWPPPWLQRGAKPQPPAKPTLHVFSVASGHLYERFLRMMFYSVHKTSSDKYGANTTRIKFWVIENFLSPQFKRYIPLLAAELGFEVGFVTYRWPWWLPRQTEKQRKIWAYKILFLDVLFPLDVDRVIFVDADQTAQADLHELYNMDIEGSPVAMTPFCQHYRNEETVRFRFWEHGFWVDHLKGKPYHISAIFLVDLRRFRAMLAGDRYRATYANLAGDPNSLANLDQDLPNYLQANIPIFSLPEQWLWCETWCSAKSKSKAKTIDLCNNPLTKMPKLDNAKMVIPGWEELDNKLQNMSDTLLREH